MTNGKLCIIVGASAILEDDFLFYIQKWKQEKRELFLIAADGGYRFLQEHHIEPDMVVGDFDSLGSEPEHRRIVRHPVVKDDTDMMLAVKEAQKEDFHRFALFGGLGNRFDHSFANIQLLSYLQGSGDQAVLFGETMHMTVLKSGTMMFPEEFAGVLSVFALSDQASGVTLKNLKYELHNKSITRTFPIGVSNEFVGRESVICVEEGELLVMWQRENRIFPHRDDTEVI